MSTVNDKHRKALGKGLSSLLPSRPIAPSPTHEEMPGKLPIDLIQPNPMQPRAVFDHTKLEELADSIRANGIIQPIIVRRMGTTYQIVAGERRWRAAKHAGLTEIPVLVQDISDPQLLELALIENIQREDLGPMEIARAYERLSSDLGMSQEQIAKRTGKDRASVSNYLRLLKLPAKVQTLLENSRLSMGHAKAVLALPDPPMQTHIAEKAVAQGMSVRQVESLVNALLVGRKTISKLDAQDPNVRAAAEELQNSLGTKVRIVEVSEQRGRIEIDYYSQEELDRLYRRLLGKE